MIGLSLILEKKNGFWLHSWCNLQIRDLRGKKNKEVISNLLVKTNTIFINGNSSNVVTDYRIISGVYNIVGSPYKSNKESFFPTK